MELLEELRHGDCSYRVYDGGAAPDAFGVFETAVMMWEAKRPPVGVPRWRDYDIPDFRGWYGQVRLGRVIERESFDLLFEYWGTALATICGCDMTGRRLSEVFVEAERAGRLELAYLRSVWQHRGIGTADVTLDAYGKGHIQVKLLDLVIGKQDHDPTHILTYCRIQRRQDVSGGKSAAACLPAAGNRGNIIDLDQARAVRAIRP
jgi:hypothetical protein